MGQRVHIAQLAQCPDKLTDPWFEIIGVVADVKNNGLQDPVQPEIWVPYTMTGSAAPGVLVRTGPDPMTLMNPIRQEIWATESKVAPPSTGTLESFIASFSSP